MSEVDREYGEETCQTRSENKAEQKRTGRWEESADVFPLSPTTGAPLVRSLFHCVCPSFDPPQSLLRDPVIASLGRSSVPTGAGVPSPDSSARRAIVTAIMKGDLDALRAAAEGGAVNACLGCRHDGQPAVVRPCGACLTGNFSALHLGEETVLLIFASE